MLRVLVVVASISFMFYLANSWVEYHALALAVNGKYVVVAEGWSAVGTILGTGLFLGFAAGFVSSSKVGEVVKTWIARNQNEEMKSNAEAHEMEWKKIADELKKIEDIKSAFQSDLHRAMATGRREGEKMANKANEDCSKSDAKVKQLERNIQFLEQRLIGARENTKRYKKKTAQLTSRDAAKPDDTET